MQRSVVLCLAAVAHAASCHAQSAPAAPRFSVAAAAEFEAGAVAFAPKWSPDGRWIAFSMLKAGGIGLVRPDGTERRTLTTEPGSGYRFAWSPDATRIAFRRERRDLGRRHYVISVAETATGMVESSSGVVRDAQPPVWQRGPEGMRWTTLAPSGAVEGSWLPVAESTNRRTAAIVAPGPPLIEQRGTELWLYHPDPARRWKLSGEFGLNAVWSPDGSMLAYDAMDRFAVLTPDAGVPPRPPVAGLNPAWSPDGAWLVYQITRDHSHEGDDRRQHTPDTAAHAHDDKTNHRIVESELWIVGADGGGRHQLTNTPDILESDPDWSPDGRAIVCRTEETGRIRVLTLTGP